ncbi:hypothetical protein ASPZODRAFT_55153 [Penicilliopsis zonata CBS 506.65]|uniref:Orc1-like AAA ATPase domain-containing protein n=1 Tax=Penicilliopsis zonata CBS 506.65 TaxID=1073090 RepID=A0A1L9SWT0_9EURO|nr:hypothetical protein ASPZODRAFT_55153 [Penicilliopsis zonata CBS 506.65]OJJ51640.1 hypothetical protein ASPZODRAFT_55153 [Penicilliopsis zonata CBS 506.65]
MLESAATTAASILILGLAGYSYHKYYKYLILQKMNNAFEPGDPALEMAGVTSGKQNYNTEEHWVVRKEQERINDIIAGKSKGHYYLIVGEKGTGKTSMLLEAMRKTNGDGVAMFEAHGDLEIFRVRLGKALDYEFHEDYIGSLFSIRGPRDTTALLDIERAFNKLEKVALSRRAQGKPPLILVMNSSHLVRDDHDGQDLLEMIQQRAEQWAASNLVTTVLNSDDYWVYERLKRYATRMEVIPVSDLPKSQAMAALKKYRLRYSGEELSDKVLAEVYDLVGGRLSFLNRVAKSKDIIGTCHSICTAEKTWFLNKCWILGMEMDDDVMDEQKYSSAAMVLAKALVDREEEMEVTYDPEKGHILPEISLHKARQIMTRADFIQSYDHDNIFTIDSRAMVRADSVPMQIAFREICSQPGFDKHLEGTLQRIGDIESLGRTRELTIKDLWDQGKYKIVVRDPHGRESGTVEFSTHAIQLGYLLIILFFFLRKSFCEKKTMPARSKKHVASSVSRSDRAALQPESSLARIPSPVRFLLVVVSSLVLSSVLFTFSADVTLGDLGAVSKHLEEWWEVGGLVGWKAVELGLAWMLGFDGRDVASSIFLTHLPTFTLLASFYGVRPTTMLASFGITLFSTAAPFALLRRPSSVHDLSHAPSGTVSNRSIIQDRATALYTTMAASSIFAVVVYLSYATWLPAQLVLHFENIPDITAAHAGPAGLPVLFLSLVPAGWAARDFLFVSSAGSTADHDEKEEGEEGQDGEYLVEAVCRQTWGRLSAKTRVLVARTFYLAVMLVLNTVVQVAGTIRGVDLQGASAWGTVWAVAALAIGFTFGWIEAVDGV